MAPPLEGATAAAAAVAEAAAAVKGHPLAYPPGHAFHTEFSNIIAALASTMEGAVAEASAHLIAMTVPPLTEPWVARVLPPFHVPPHGALHFDPRKAYKLLAKPNERAKAAFTPPPRPAVEEARALKTNSSPKTLDQVLREKSLDTGGTVDARRARLVAHVEEEEREWNRTERAATAAYTAFAGGFLEEMERQAPRRCAAFTLAYLLNACTVDIARRDFSKNLVSWPTPPWQTDLMRGRHVDALELKVDALSYKGARERVVLRLLLKPRRRLPPK